MASPDDDLRSRVNNILLTFATADNPRWISANSVDVADALIDGLGWVQEWRQQDEVLEHRYTTEWKTP